MSVSPAGALVLFGVFVVLRDLSVLASAQTDATVNLALELPVIVADFALSIAWIVVGVQLWRRRRPRVRAGCGDAVPGEHVVRRRDRLLPAAAGPCRDAIWPWPISPCLPPCPWCASSPWRWSGAESCNGIGPDARARLSGGSHRAKLASASDPIQPPGGLIDGIRCADDGNPFRRRPALPQSVSSWRDRRIRAAGVAPGDVGGPGGARPPTDQRRGVLHCAASEPMGGRVCAATCC